MFQELPNEYVAPSDLPEVVELGDMRKVYGTVVSKEDYLEHKDGRKFDAAEFESHPERYTSSFAQKAGWAVVGGVTVPTLSVWDCATEYGGWCWSVVVCGPEVGSNCD